MLPDGQMDKENVFTHGGILFSPKKGNPDIWDSIDGPGGHYAKCKKPDTERQTLHDLTYTWNPK